MEGGSNSTCSNIMAFGDITNNGINVGSMMMIPSSSYALLSPFPSPPLITSCVTNLDHQTQKNHSSNGSSRMVFENQMSINTNHPSGGGGGGGGCYFMKNDNDSGANSANNTSTLTPPGSVCSMKTKIMAHPHYPRLLSAYFDCQKIGAPPDVVARLEEACASAASRMASTCGSSCLGEDPALDQFMEAYCEMLIKYEQELCKPLKEALHFLQRAEHQFKALTMSSPISASGEAFDRNGSCEEEAGANNNYIDPQAEDQELKGQLLRRYSGYLGSLKQEFTKKRKKGKLPKEARQQLLDWWSRHYKWPYPSESQKLALAESTGLDQKQINNWFINQRKRHWKPSEDMQFVLMDASHPHYFMNNVFLNPFQMDISHPLL